MGSIGSTGRKDPPLLNGEVNFDHFQILRAIGKGSFGKVCIVQKKDTKKMYAMKYMNKQMCIRKDAVRNVLREQEFLCKLDHPFIVNLWFSFQDEEDMFFVVDLLLGGDLRYHMTQDTKFELDQVRLYLCEIALALDYLHTHYIIHRDIKPDNILLDEEGHIHLTDFNVATQLEGGSLATSMSGTKPYMAPELISVGVDGNVGYSFPVDWWATGIVAFEIISYKRPYEIHSETSMSECLQMFQSKPVHFSSHVNHNLCDIIRKMLSVSPDERLCSLSQLKQHSLMNDIDWEAVHNKKLKPSFVPRKDHLNCDPTFELEEMIIETKPLHKKKKRLAKQRSKEKAIDVNDPIQVGLENLHTEFTVYNREKEKDKGTTTECDSLKTNEMPQNEDENCKQTRVCENISAEP